MILVKGGVVMRTWMVTVALLLVAWTGGLGTAVILDTFRDHGSAQSISEPSREPGSPPSDEQLEAIHDEFCGD